MYNLYVVEQSMCIHTYTNTCLLIVTASVRPTPRM